MFLYLEGAVEDWHRIFDINVIAFCICTREAVKIMKTNNIAGHIIHIRTIPQQHVTSNCFNVFSASKLAVAGLTEAVRQELYYSSNNRIKVTVWFNFSIVLNVLFCIFSVLVLLELAMNFKPIRNVKMMKLVISIFGLKMWQKL